jgi:DNA-binding CsgD family transcriptional regulator
VVLLSGKVGREMLRRRRHGTTAGFPAKPVKTLDIAPAVGDDPVVASARTPTSGNEHAVRARAAAAADAGSPAEAFALVAARAEDLAHQAPFDAARLLAEAAWYAQLAHGPERALRVAEDALRLAPRANGEVELVVRSRLGDALQWNGRYAEARAQWLTAAAAATPKNPGLLCTRADALIRSGDLVAGREAAYAAATRARERADALALYQALTFQAIAEIHLGLLREAHASARQVEAAAGAAPGGDRLDALGLLAWIEGLAGDEEACRDHLAAADALAAGLELTPSGGLAAGLLELTLGRYDQAVAQLRAKLDGRPPLACALSLRPFVDGLVEACVRSGRQAEALELASAVVDEALTTGQPRYTALAFRMRALAEDRLDDFSSALDAHAEWGNRFEEGRTRLLYGEALRRRKRRGEAREQLSSALSSFATVGARTWELRALAELRAAGARLPRAGSGAALTSQEERVALLVADGLPNKEIAARLVLSTKTVEGHLRNIFEKLGATSRTQVARAVSR